MKCVESVWDWCVGAVSTDYLARTTSQGDEYADQSDIWVERNFSRMYVKFARHEGYFPDIEKFRHVLIAAAVQREREINRD